MRSDPKQIASMLGIPVGVFKDALKQYRKDVPTVGTINETKAQQFLSAGHICRGWIETADGKMYFHIIKSPEDYPHKAFFSGDNEAELFGMTVALGMEHEIELEDLVTE